MSVIIDNNLILSPLEEAQPIRHARILYRTIWRKSGATIDASSEQDGFPASALTNELTYEFWRPESLPATWEVDAGEAVEVNACGIAAHTLGSEGNFVEVQYHDGGDWSTVADFAPKTDDPILFLFEKRESERWRIRIDGDKEPSIGVVFFGKALEMYRPIYQGHSPLKLSRETVREPNRSERGQWLGISVTRRGVGTDFSWEHLPADWYREQFDPFAEYASQGPGTFFIAWRPSQFPQEVGYCWLDQDDIQPDNSGPRNFMSVSMSVRGQIGFETPDQSRWS